MKKANKKWIVSTGVLAVVTVVLIVANILGNIFAPTINWFLGTADATSGTTSKGEVYFPSEFVKKNADGTVMLDEKGKEVYDSVALSAASDALVQEVAAEGFVLLYNNGALPLEKGSTVSLFGQSVDNPVTSGTGSGATGGASGRFDVSITAGGLKLNEDSYKFYSEGAGRQYRLAVPGMHDNNPFRINECPWEEVKADPSFNAMINCDTAVVVFSRNGGEGYDLSNGASDVGYDFGLIDVADPLTVEEGSLTGNNYLELNGTERGVLAGVKELKDQGKIKNIVVLLNASNALELDFLDPEICGVDYGIDACMWIGATGQSGVNAVGKVLSGDINPSGRLVDTYCYDNLREPSIYNFGHNKYPNFESDFLAQSKEEFKDAWLGQAYYNIYREGIYVGYRYYETRYEDMVLGNTTGFDYDKIVAYAFGHGLSYTTFSYSNFSVKDNGDSTMTATVTVTNTGSVAGKEVVELYAQTPYTDYDKQNKIEKASIELVGFNKTQLLDPGASETLEITFKKELLAAYDAYGAKTYIMDAGDYYLALGNGAHDALNKILVEKGADASRMIAAPATATGEGSLVYKWTEAALDTTTYAISSSTGNAITNQFDDADLNLYDNGSQSVTYVSRSDWNGTFDISSLASMQGTGVVLNITQKMYSDLICEQYTSPANNLTMPKSSVENGLKLIQFRGVPLDGSITHNGKEYTWDDLVDQLSNKQMRELIARGQHTTMVLAAVGKPGTKDHNGPSGFNTTFVGGGSGAAYPVPCLRASTWNLELAKRVGELIGEDGLHSNTNGLYGPGANTHRNAYCGRNFEYYSEDPAISSIFGAEEVKGIQSKGIIVYIKHFALNDSESHREGVATWVGEQALREIYLEAFRGIMKIDGGNSHAAMSAFNRFGTVWAGNSAALVENVTRGEWGFDGFIVTDADACDTTTHCTFYMYAPLAVTTGTDLYDGVNNHDRSNQLAAYKDDPYVAHAMRNATKRILYNVANSAAMNGLGLNVEVKETLPWWQLTVRIALGVSVAATLVSAAMLFVSANPKKKK